MEENIQRVVPLSGLESFPHEKFNMYNKKAVLQRRQKLVMETINLVNGS